MFGTSEKKTTLVTEETALPGRPEPVLATATHFVSKRNMFGPYPEGAEIVYFGMGCFWGAERLFWELDGVWVTAAGYAGGYTKNPVYEEVCTGQTGHAEVVMVVFEPADLSFDRLLRTFWEAHNPTSGMRQGNDIGTQYRSLIGHTTEAQKSSAERSLRLYQDNLGKRGFGKITTEIVKNPAFYPAEEYHQQYLAKNPAGYCGLKGTGVSCEAAGEPQHVG